MSLMTFLILGDTFKWLRVVQSLMIMAALLELSAVITMSVTFLIARINNREKRLKDFSFAAAFNVISGIKV